MRMTIPVAKVLSALLADAEAPRYGLDLMKLTGLPSGTLYPVLHRLQAAGWLAADWEEVDPATAGRPARRYYLLTAEGVHAARQALAELRALAPDGGTSWGGAEPTGVPAW
ncbi:PadR family transcriptional regulator [Micromonospora sp. DR5-3]|uniref:PadR family transcriptional regulator n=1 Tax=unclassified Micromonospora TaxID=2617518 RepID=UPI0011D67030|nr:MULTISPECIES: PadR family transcriptional regulator [unclassified Micromonospora]MCW3814199.1 PadR family transcriptional regulator [Micromonospora sp. DR5-3]TYC25079.1 PadR family transcriptional regulator [Micromonospora sp. MP36]